MNWSGYLFILFFVAAAFFIVAALVLWWSVKRGHFQQFDAQAQSIFEDDEPEGVVIDRFPPKRKAAAAWKQ